MDGNILVIAGVDSGGAAGIHADIKTINNFNCFVTTSVTAITVQNSITTSDIFPIPVDYIKKQILCILNDFTIDVIKIGMLYDVQIMTQICNLLTEKAPNIPIIFDPVWCSSQGAELLKINNMLLDYLKQNLIASSYLITPNIPEAEKILNRSIHNLDDMVVATQTFKDMGATNILLKGGHGKGDIIYDILLSNKTLKIYESKRIDTENTRGSGCSLASAIAANIAQNKTLPEAVSIARAYIYKSILNAVKLGKGMGSLNHSNNVHNNKKLLDI
jgi:hydroxymethylpyrimidine kinase/phosphomethylpyrimidine kinase